MARVDFAYEIAADVAGLPLGVSIYADEADLCDVMREEVAAAGFAVRECGVLADLAGGDPCALGDLVLIDCRRPDAEAMALLSRLDSRVAHAGARMIVTTSAEGLEDVFAACGESRAQILVDPMAAERVIALGQTLVELPNPRLRELSDRDRLALLRLTEQVGKIAERLDGIDRRGWGLDRDSAFRFESPTDAYAAPEPQVLRKARPPLPSARLVRKIIAARKVRGKFIDSELFADPAWDMLLDLTAARVEHQRVSVTSLCIASGVPPTTALRWIGQMTDAGLFERVDDDTDRRRAFIRLTDKAADAMARYFVELGQETMALV